MIVKFIVCQVGASQRRDFSHAQQQWRALCGVDGFLGQVGGWAAKEPCAAVILGGWRDSSAYDCFMGEIHDNIFHAFNQQSCYEGIEVSIWDQVLDMKGSAGTFGEAVPEAGFLRIARCAVRPERVDHFVEIQETSR